MFREIKMMKKILGLVVVSSLWLSGCNTTLALGEAHANSLEKRWVVQHEDTIIAIGQPKQKIVGYENALALAGQKNGYLLHMEDGSDKLQRIFQTVDLIALKVNMYENQPFVAMRKAGNGWECSSAYGCANISLYFEKLTTSVTKNEQEQLEKLGFHCRLFDKNMTFCHTSLKVALTVTQAVTNQQNLSHRMQSPVPIKIQAFDKNHGKLSRVGMLALAPIAIAFDLVTSPIQGVMGIVDEKYRVVYQ